MVAANCSGSTLLKARTPHQTGATIGAWKSPCSSNEPLLAVTFKGVSEGEKNPGPIPAFQVTDGSLALATFTLSARVPPAGTTGVLLKMPLKNESSVRMDSDESSAIRSLGKVTTGGGGLPWGWPTVRAAKAFSTAANSMEEPPYSAAAAARAPMRAR